MAEKQSLAAKAGAIAVPEMQLPSIFTAPPEEIKGREFGPYVTFAHANKKDEYAKIVAKLGQPPNDGDMFLIQGDRVTHLPIMKCTLVCLKQYWVEKDSQGKVLKTSLAEKPRPWAEHMDGVLMVYVDDTVVPCTIQPHTTKCPGFKVLNDALREAGTAEWAAKSPAHKETMVIQQPFWRFYGMVSVAPPRNPKHGGNPYRLTQTVIQPSGPTEWRAIQKFTSDKEASEKLLNQAQEGYNYRINELSRLKAS